MTDKKTNVKAICGDGFYIGADGCRGGWIAAVLDHGVLHLNRYESIGVLIKTYPVFDAFLIDMAIGLRNSPQQLRPDDLARKELGTRASTIFPVPSRSAVYADGEAEQKKANLRTLGKSLSKQTINIIPKIRELDEFLDNHPEYKNKILESHPELDFARLSGSVLLSRKKDESGIKERAGVLRDYLPDISSDELKEQAKELRCNIDDIADAICLAVSASLVYHGLCETIPPSPQQDGRGLYMMLTVPQKNTERRL